MATLDVIVDKLVELWKIPAIRQRFPWIFLVICFVGSVLQYLEVVPQTYFSSSKNALNVYFVKLSWGWTLLLLTPFLILSYSSSTRSRYFLGRRLLALVVATAIWYFCTETFFYIENLTGSCFETHTMDVINKEFTSKASCKRAGFHWLGYDISGHSFILAYAALLIVEETAHMASLKRASLSVLHRMLLNLLYLALNVLLIIWVWMFACTSVYFHDVHQKLLGTICGLLGWHLTYRVWYLSSLSPGLPPQPHRVGQKQHA